MNKEKAIDRIMTVSPSPRRVSVESSRVHVCVAKKTQGDHVKDAESSAVPNHRMQRHRHHLNFHYNQKTRNDV